MCRSLALPAFLVAAGLLSQTAFAAPTNPTFQSPYRMGEHRPMGELRFPRGMGLDLTPAQEKKMLALMRTTFPQREAIMRSTTLTPQQKSLKLQALRLQFHNRMNAILTPAQRKKRDAMRKERFQRRQQQEGVDPAA